MNNGAEINSFQCPEHFLPILLIEQRPSGTFINKGIRCNSNDKTVAQCPSGLQILQMTDMQDIKNAMGKH